MTLKKKPAIEHGEPRDPEHVIKAFVGLLAKVRKARRRLKTGKKP